MKSWKISSRMRLPDASVCIAIALGLVLIYTSTCQAQWSQRDRDLHPEQVLDSIGVKSGMVIGEVGAGDGYLTFKLARKVGPSGKIYANDINESALNRLSKKAAEDSVENIHIVVGETVDPLFPQKNLDMIVMILVYHDLEKPLMFMQNLKAYLKPAAPVVIIDRDPERWGKGFDHFMKKDDLIRSVQNAGYRLSRLETFPVMDNVYIFLPER